MIKFSSVKYQSSEIAFNLDDELANQITALTDRTPILKALFSFPRTGINALKYRDINYCDVLVIGKKTHIRIMIAV